ncbi:2-aminoethylphosphonate ABC transporter substrate-binding protein [Streptomyces sp. SID486]|uniref:2-aminoethylphosphonate ABC transporter substrate-binding protein n=1 Tax=unclassified Streptomyces TaxID=2593676 RepID=UPI00136F8652|nr:MULTISPECIES: 2-aminoethylphosphonate ABC transporter substrate-binding protein [unclassified Streptomyces]MYW21258.1 2-aminoethylphosphonate ABC transporter substrate-binding protein [Streptomyces sp. SID2955]MYW47154.1 2-aminoethylphosphonate ABC transporter substrate-binding protein [Streptomyces sp. SID161]MYX96524.1 2-aminoethylphosphonate ABC transporter substrate-binding protein [Streptomyces sp. SID486]
MPRNRVALAAALALLATPALSACGGSSAASDADVVTVYSADGLKGENGDGWYDKVFADFEKQTGIKVEYVEGGSGEMVQRAVREKSNPQADVLVTLPPFIQQAGRKGLLQKYAPQGADQVSGADKAADGTWTSVVDNYFGFVYDKKELKQAPRTWDELLDGKYRNRLQYSTPGVAGDGTAVLVKAMHDFGGKDQALAYLKKLQANNVGPSASTGKLAPKVDKGELLVANGDVQMNYAQTKSMPGLGIWFPAGPGGRPSTFALPYAAGLVTRAPHSGNGRKLLDFMLGRRQQQEVSEIGGGFSSRKDVKATDADAIALAGLMDGVEVFEPDWDDIDRNLTSYVEDWKSATGS